VRYAWRVVRADGSPTAVTLHLEDESDGLVVALVQAAAEKHGIRLEPIELEPPPLVAA